MADARWMYDNLVDAATLTASSEEATLPVENIQNEQRSKPWQTGTSVADEWVVLDLGSAQAFTCAVLLDHDLTSGDSAIAIEANATDSWGAPSFSQALTRVAGPIAAYFASQSYRYVRIKLTKSSAGEARSIGRVFVGTYLDSATISSLNFDKVDPSPETKSIGGQSYHDIRPSFDRISVDFEVEAKAVRDSLEAMFDDVGKHTAIFVSLNHDVEPVDWIYYVKIKNDMKLTAVASTNNWRTAIQLEEQL